MIDLVEKMEPRDHLSIVSYSSDCTLDLAMMSMEPDNKETARLAVKAMHAAGGTNIEAGECCDGCSMT